MKFSNQLKWLGSIAVITALLNIVLNLVFVAKFGYQWAAVLDADAFEAFKETGLFDKTTAEAFRKNILEMGGTDEPMKLYKQFRGAEPSTEPMLKRKGLI